MTTPQIATMYGITRQRVNQIAKARRIVGEKVGNTIVYTNAQARALKPGPNGRPKQKP